MTVTASDRDVNRPRKIVPAAELYGQRRRRKTKRALVLFFIALVITLSVLAYLRWGDDLIAFVTNPARVREAVRAYPVTSRLAFIALMFIQILIAFIPGEPFELAAGYAFGFWEGTLIAMIAIYLASIVIFFLVRRFGKPALELFFDPEEIDQIRILNDTRGAVALLVILFLIPGTPSDLFTYFAGLTPMRFSTWMLVVLARIPSVMSSTASGGFFGSEQYTLALVILGVTALFALIGVAFYKNLVVKKKKENGSKG